MRLEIGELFDKVVGASKSGTILLDLFKLKQMSLAEHFELLENVNDCIFVKIRFLAIHFNDFFVINQFS